MKKKPLKFKEFMKSPARSFETKSSGSGVHKDKRTKINKRLIRKELNDY